MCKARALPDFPADVEEFDELVLEASQRPAVTVRVAVSSAQAQRLQASLGELAALLACKTEDESLQRGGLEMLEYSHSDEDGLRFEVLCNPNACEGEHDATCLVKAESAAGLSVSAEVPLKKLMNAVDAVVNGEDDGLLRAAGVGTAFSRE